METDLDRLFRNYVGKAFANPEDLSADGTAALKRAFYAGAWSVLTTLPTANPALAQQVADFARQTDVCADLLRQQCAGFAATTENRIVPRVPETYVPAPAPEFDTNYKSTAVTDAPIATSDSPNSDLPLSDLPPPVE